MEIRRIKDDELYHHGIKGQRWGVRRYQNADGTLTDAGRKKYLKSIDKTKLDYTDYNRAYKEANDIGNAIVNKLNNSQYKRTEDAADTGMRALDRIGEYDIGEKGHYNQESEDTKRSVREWLAYEDQTIGYVEVADLANQGKSSKEILKTIKDASEKYNTIKKSGQQVMEQIENEYLTDLFKTDYATESYIKDKTLKSIDNMEGLFDLDYLNSELSYGGEYSSKINKYIDACVKEATIKNKK